MGLLDRDKNSGKESERLRFTSEIWRKLDIQCLEEEKSHVTEHRLI